LTGNATINEASTDPALPCLMKGPPRAGLFYGRSSRAGWWYERVDVYKGWTPTRSGLNKVAAGPFGNTEIGNTGNQA